MDEQLKENVKRRGIWLRLLFMLVMVLAFNVAELVLGAVVIFQFFASLFTGKANPQIQTFGRQLGTYLRDIATYLTFETEERPFPFAPWPEGAEPAPPAKPKPRRTRKAPAKKADA